MSLAVEAGVDVHKPRVYETPTQAKLSRIFGRTLPFTASQIVTLYPTHAQFVLQWNLATLKDFLGGYLLRPDAIELDNAALASSIGG
jgi:Alpha/beta hydrolase domain